MRKRKICGEDGGAKTETTELWENFKIIPKRVWINIWNGNERTPIRSRNRNEELRTENRIKRRKWNSLAAVLSSREFWADLHSVTITHDSIVKELGALLALQHALVATKNCINVARKSISVDGMTWTKTWASKTKMIKNSVLFVCHLPVTSDTEMRNKPCSVMSDDFPRMRVTTVIVTMPTWCQRMNRETLWIGRKRSF